MTELTVRFMEDDQDVTTIPNGETWADKVECFSEGDLLGTAYRVPGSTRWTINEVLHDRSCLYRDPLPALAHVTGLPVGQLLAALG